MSTAPSTVRVFAGTDGAYYTPSQLRRRCHVDGWRFCMYERNTGRLAFERPDRSLLVVVPIEADFLPPWYELRREHHVVRAVDTRRRRRSIRAIGTDN